MDSSANASVVLPGDKTGPPAESIFLALLGILLVGVVISVQPKIGGLLLFVIVLGMVYAGLKAKNI